MHDKLTRQSQVLRKGSHRIICAAFLAIAGFSAYKLNEAGWSPPIFLIPLLFALGGAWFLLADTRYILFIDDGHLYWADHNGKKKQQGSVPIADIARLDAYKIRVDPNRPKMPADSKLRFLLTLRDGGKIALPPNLNLGGPGNPNY